MAHMPRPVRVPDDVWQAALARARDNGTTLSAVVIDALTRYATDGPVLDERARIVEQLRADAERVVNRRGGKRLGVALHMAAEHLAPTD